MALSPNVSAGFANGGQSSARLGGDRSTQQLSISGNRREWNYFTLDGMDNTDVNFNTYLFLPSIDALQEFKVQTGVYSAEFGREVGQVNVSTKSGTNEYHGTVFEFLRNNDLDARPFGFTAKVPISVALQVEPVRLHAGRPDPDSQDCSTARTGSSSWPTTRGSACATRRRASTALRPAAMRGGDFSQILPGTVITDPLNNNQPFAEQSSSPRSRLDPISVGLLEFFPGSQPAWLEPGEQLPGARQQCHEQGPVHRARRLRRERQVELVWPL